MAKNDQQEAYEKQLSASLTRTIDWLKFAEAKNAALLTFASAWMLGCVNLLSVDRKMPAHFDTALRLDVLLFSIAALTAFGAILPKLKLSDFVGTSAPSTRNLLYFGHIALFDTEVFKERVRASYMPTSDNSVTDTYLEDMATQIAVNSQIADRKFRLFDRGARIALLGVLVMLWPMSTLAFDWIRSLC